MFLFGVDLLGNLCWHDFVPFTETRITLSQSFMRVKRHSCVDEVTVNRDKPPLLLWEQAWPLTPDLNSKAVYIWLSLRLFGLPDHKHLPWAWWMVTCERWGQLHQPHTESTSWPQIRRCVYVDVHLNNSFSSCRFNISFVVRSNERWKTSTGWKLKSAKACTLVLLQSRILLCETAV